MFEEVRSRHAEFLTSVLWKLTGDKELFEEALQYSLLQMWRHLEKLKGKKAASYIYRIALSANSKAWRNRIGKDGHFNQYEPKADAASDNTERIEHVRQEISRLPDKQAQALIMKYLEQKDYETIAKQLHCQSTTARSNVSKALAALRQSILIQTNRE